MKLLANREYEKAADLKSKILQEKSSRDKQLTEEQHRKHHEEKQQHHQEVELVKRLQSEME